MFSVPCWVAGLLEGEPLCESIVRSQWPLWPYRKDTPSLSAPEFEQWLNSPRCFKLCLPQQRQASLFISCFARSLLPPSFKAMERDLFRWKAMPWWWYLLAKHDQGQLRTVVILHTKICQSCRNYSQLKDIDERFSSMTRRFHRDSALFSKWAWRKRGEDSRIIPATIFLSQTC